MRLTRHARNRLRWIGRSHPSVSEAQLLEALPTGEILGKDDRGNRRVRVSLAGVRLTVVVDDSQGVIITVWID